jgi:hypothetical protein
MRPQDESVAASLLGLRLPKHGARTLRRRQKNRPRRRAQLANTWSRVMAQVNHPVAALWRAFWAKRGLRGELPIVSADIPGWKSFKKAARR